MSIYGRGTPGRRVIVQSDLPSRIYRHSKTVIGPVWKGPLGDVQIQIFLLSLQFSSKVCEDASGDTVAQKNMQVDE